MALAAEVGLDPDEVRQTLAGDRYAEDVRDDERTAASFGISGVPMFVVDRAIGASGAQPPEVMLELLRRGWAESHTAGRRGCRRELRRRRPLSGAEPALTRAGPGASDR